MGVDRKQIAVICNYKLLPDRVGGMDYFFWAFDKKCKENNVEVDWFFPNYSNHDSYTDLNIISSKQESAFEVFVLNSLEKDYSLIFTHFVELCTSFYCKLKKQTAARVIAVDHNPRPLKGYPLKKRIKKRLKGWLYSKCIDQFIGVSTYTTHEILKDFGSSLEQKTSVIYNGIFIDHIQTNTDRSDKFPKFLVASHLRESKGVQDLIEAVGLLPEPVKSKLTIDVYGEGPYEDVLKARVNALSLTKVFAFKGSVSNLNQIYGQYDYMLQPTHMECFSLSILESLAANVPVITTNVGGNEEAVTHGENGYIFKAKDISKLKDIIEDVFSGEKYIKVNTRTLIEASFSIRNMVENYFKLIS
ncbi:glycosyltransferase family 4 protein [Seonamhaeicola sp.]|uniref:glycosyltransferase family 4 protein n=1 Tax=Seonamhaeicola sp. TaxID=1912245 RepID=UPI002610A75E|nr:glycosyltransferase family 4 protein [Seonamhaeicola sp.]